MTDNAAGAASTGVSGPLSEDVEAALRPMTEPHAAEKDACEHPYWNETGDGHTRSGWECTTCGRWQWIAPWVLGIPTPPGKADR